MSEPLLRVVILACLFFSGFPHYAGAQVNFTPGKLAVAPFHPTSLQYGPDGKLYVAVQDGTIYRYTIQKTDTGYLVANTETITLVKQIPNHNDNGTLNTTVTSRQVTGLLVTGTASNPMIYVTSSDPRIGGSGTENSSPAGDGDLDLDTNSGIVSLLTFNGTTWSKTDLVRGLPRSEENHSQNGLALDPATNQLYVTSGGSTNAGSPSVKFAMITEYALSACLLKIDLNAINNLPVLGSGNNKYVYDIPTLDDPTRSNSGTADIDDPFGGNDGRNQAKVVAGGPVQVFAPGYRNIYDVVFTKTPGAEGRIYAVDNGPNQSWGGYPDQEGTPNVTNNYVVGEPGSLGPGINDGQVNNMDNFHLIYKPGITPVYGGHPTPVRANPAGAGLFWKDITGNHFELNPTNDWPPVPVSMGNPVEADFRNPGVNDGALTTFYSSTNGITEYTSTVFFDGEMAGDILTVSFDGSIYRLQLSADGNAVTSKTVLASGFGSVPLDITAQGDNDIFPGTIWVADYVSNSIYYFEPRTSSEGIWATITPSNSIYPEKRHENAFVELNGKFYLFGGRGSKPVNVFDPVTRTWSTAAPIPNSKELHHFQAVALNNKIFIINAFTGSYPSESPVPDIYIYDAGSNSWTIQANAIPLARRRGSGASVVHNNKIYLAGGITNGHNNGAVNWTDVYDPATGNWTILANAPHARDHVQGAVINGKIYLAGGRRTSASTGALYSDPEPSVDVYDIASTTWTTLPSSANLPIMRGGASSVSFNGKLVVIGGESPQALAHNEVHELDPFTSTWRLMPPLVTGRHGTQATIYNNNIFIAAGNAQKGGSVTYELNTIESYPNIGNTCTGDSSSTTLDDDGDGFSNKDETDNQTDPCSAASMPRDNDGDKVSNLNDPDDDNDGIPDISDAFHIDSQNGKNKYPPFSYPFLNGDPGTGLFGMGFTGLMSNGVTDPDDLYSETANGLIMGGAVGLATIPATSGNAMSNNQRQAFQFGFMLNSASPLTTMESSVVHPFFDGDSVSLLKNELHGIYIGTGDQDNYVAISITPNFGNPAISVIKEIGGVVLENLYPVSGLLNGNVQLYLEIDAAAGSVQPKYKTGSDSTAKFVGPKITLAGKLLTTLQGPDAVAAGVLATARNGGNFSATWDYMNIHSSTPPPTNGSEKRINSGGPAVSAGGFNWSADGSFTDTDPLYPSTIYSTTNPITNTTIPVIYQTERYGKGFTYNIPITNGSYTVKLHFAELYWSASGQRMFSVNLENGQGSLSNFDIFAEAGAKYKALINSFNVNVTDGNMTIAFTAIKDMAKISGIEIIPTNPAPSIPVANAGPDKSLTLPANSTVLDGSGTDADGSIASYQWLQVNGPNTATFSSATAQKPTVSNLVSGLYVFSLTVKDNSGLSSSPDSVTVTVNSSASTDSALRINAGGPAVTINGLNWIADKYWTDINSSYPSWSYKSTAAIANTEADVVYQTERYGKGFTYNIPLANGTYEVRIHFAELFWTGKGQRVMNINVENGQGSLNDFDILAEVAKNTALIKTFSVDLADGSLTIQLTAVTDNAKISGIEIISSSVAPPPPPPPPPPPTGTSIRINGGGPALTLNGETWSADTHYSADVTSTYKSSATITNTGIPAIYQTERYGKTFSYDIPIASGSYEVRLHFAELYWNATGARIFNVDVENGQGKLNNFDIFATGGKNNAVIRSFIVNATDGSINVTFNSITDNAKISGIEVLPATNTVSPIPDTVEKITDLTVNVAPNPSTNEFNLSFITEDSASVQVRVVNSSGAIMDVMEKIDPRSVINLGARYARGTYYVEIRQGTLRVVKALMKL